MRLTSLLPCFSFLWAACAMTGPAPRELEASLGAPAFGASSTLAESAMFAPMVEPAGAPAARAWGQEEMDKGMEKKKKKKEPWINIFTFLSGRELDEVTFENEDTDVEVDVNNVETTRTGVGVAFGRRSVRGYVQGFVESMESDFDGATITGLELDADGIGFGGGVMGEPILHSFNESTHLILPYRLDLGLVVANDDDLEIDLVYYDTRLEAGLGVDWNGLQPSIGVRVDTLLGGVEAEDDINEDEFDATFTGFNAGFYGGLRYKHPEFPLWIDVRATFGDLEGVTGALGWSL